MEIVEYNSLTPYIVEKRQKMNKLIVNPLILLPSSVSFFRIIVFFFFFLMILVSFLRNF